MEILSQSIDFDKSAIMKYYDKLETLEDFQQAREALRFSAEGYIDAAEEAINLVDKQNKKSKTHIWVSRWWFNLVLYYFSVASVYSMLKLCNYIWGLT